jgi:Putative prokaryotic signal transducing protein
MAKALLESHGIDSFISVDNEGGMLPALNQRGIKLIVMAVDFEKAVEILNSTGDIEE